MGSVNVYEQLAREKKVAKLVDAMPRDYTADGDGPNSTRGCRMRWMRRALYEVRWWKWLLTTGKWPMRAGAHILLFIAHKTIKPFAEKHLGSVHLCSIPI